MREREQIEWEEEKGTEILEETDRMAVKTEALKDEGEREAERERQRKRESKLTAACHMETVPNSPISRPQIEPAVFSDTARAPVPH